MAIGTEQLKKYLDDYAAVTGDKTDLFICPLTLNKCEPAKLIEAHILNRRLLNASRRQIIGFGDVDHFYGSRVEPTLIRFLNAPMRTEQEILQHCHDLKVRFVDGTEFPAVYGRPEMAKKFPLVTLNRDGKPFASVYVKTAKDDARLNHGPVELSHTEQFMPAHWVAAMLKSGYLTMFDLLGYRAVFDPFGDHVRRCLAQYYTDRASAKSAPTYFNLFRNAVKFMFRPGATANEVFQFDTLKDRVLLFHYTPSNTLFAATCVFKINGLNVTVTLPQSMTGADVVASVQYYNCLMENDLELPQVIRLAKTNGESWDVVAAPLAIRYVDEVPKERSQPAIVPQAGGSLPNV